MSGSNFAAVAAILLGPVVVRHHTCTPSRSEPGATPASELFDQPAWLRDFAKVIVASIGPDETVVVNSSKGMFREGLSKETSAKAKSIVNYACAACRGELETASAREIIAGKAGIDDKEMAP